MKKPSTGAIARARTRTIGRCSTPAGLAEGVTRFCSPRACLQPLSDPRVGRRSNCARPCSNAECNQAGADLANNVLRVCPRRLEGTSALDGETQDLVRDKISADPGGAMAGVRRVAVTTKMRAFLVNVNRRSRKVFAILLPLLHTL